MVINRFGFPSVFQRPGKHTVTCTFAPPPRGRPITRTVWMDSSVKDTGLKPEPSGTPLMLAVPAAFKYVLLLCDTCEKPSSSQQRSGYELLLYEAGADQSSCSHSLELRAASLPENV